MGDFCITTTPQQGPRSDAILPVLPVRTHSPCWLYLLSHPTTGVKLDPELPLATVVNHLNWAACWLVPPASNMVLIPQVTLQYRLFACVVGKPNHCLLTGVKEEEPASAGMGFPVMPAWHYCDGLELLPSFHTYPLNRFKGRFKKPPPNQAL